MSYCQHQPNISSAFGFQKHLAPLPCIVSHLFLNVIFETREFQIGHSLFSLVNDRSFQVFTTLTDEKSSHNNPDEWMNEFQTLSVSSYQPSVIWEYKDVLIESWYSSQWMMHLSYNRPECEAVSRLITVSHGSKRTINPYQRLYYAIPNTSNVTQATLWHIRSF